MTKLFGKGRAQGAAGTTHKRHCSPQTSLQCLPLPKSGPGSQTKGYTKLGKTALIEFVVAGGRSGREGEEEGKGVEKQP